MKTTGKRRESIPGTHTECVCGCEHMWKPERKLEFVHKREERCNRKNKKVSERGKWMKQIRENLHH